MFPAFGLEIAVATPRDAEVYAASVEAASQEFNRVHGHALGALTTVRRWRHDASPTAGSPQDTIDEQVIDPADCLVAIFWTRVGASGSAEGEGSGTIGEILRAIRAKKTVLIYCSAENPPLDSIDPEQVAALRDFREAWRDRALFKDFASATELQREVTDELVKMVRRIRSEGGRAPDTVAQQSVPAELEQLRSALAARAAVLRNTWRATAANQMAEANELKAILQQLAYAVEQAYERVVAFLGTADAALPEDLGSVARMIYEAGQIEMYLDGGMSYGELVAEGTRAFEMLRVMTDDSWLSYVVLRLPVAE